MIYIILSCICIFIAFFFYIRHRIILSKKLAQLLPGFLEDINHFNNEYTELTKQLISPENEANFLNKWKNLYSEISKFHISKKKDYYTQIENFKNT
jgi:hypothetical protein